MHDCALEEKRDPQRASRRTQIPIICKAWVRALGFSVPSTFSPLWLTLDFRNPPTSSAIALKPGEQGDIGDWFRAWVAKREEE